MSEHLNNNKSREEAIWAFSKELIISGNAKEIIPEYQWMIDTVSDRETMQVIDRLIAENDIPFKTIKANIAKLLNVFYLSLKRNNWDKPDETHFLNFMMLENREVEKIMNEMKTEIKNQSKQNEKDFYLVKKSLKQLEEYELHYIKKENILFPFIEKTFPQYRCLQLMWSFHDDFRRLLKELNEILSTESPDQTTLYKKLGDLYFVVLPIIFREEYIIYPIAYQSIPEKVWDEMMEQSFETGWAYIKAPSIGNKKRSINKQNPGHFDNIKDLIDLETGFLSAKQIILMMENLPVDITFVDENDEVRYFSGIKHRIFPRSKAIIGRKVQNCHPRESVHIVNEIIESFRSGEKDHADFWIQMKGKFIHIRYYALRDENTTYKGTIEVSQDVTEIRGLEGEKRLL